MIAEKPRPDENGDGHPNLPAARSGSITWLILLAVLLVASGVLRFYKLDAVGLKYFDDFTYTTVAYRWSLGEFINTWAKPGYHLIGAAAFKVLGTHDYSLGYLNSFCDILTILLIFFVGKRLGMSNVSSFSASLLYAFSPWIIIWSRSALTHMSSTLILLCSFLMLVNYLKTKRKIPYIILCGLGVSYAGHIHPTLFCFIPYFGFVIVVSCLRLPIERRNIVTALAHGFIFGISCAVVFAGFGLLLFNEEPHTGSGVIAALIDGVTGPLFHHYDIAEVRTKPGFLTGLYLSVKEMVALILLPIFIFGCAALGSLLVRLAVDRFRQSGDEDTRVIADDVKYLAITWATVPYFIVVYSFIGKSILSRVMVPVTPFFILGTFLSAELALKKRKNRYAEIILFSVTLLVAAGNLYLERRSLVEMAEPTIYRQVGDVLYGKVNDKSQLLITPSMISRRGDGFTFYLSGNYHYIPMAEVAHRWNMDEYSINERRLKKHYHFIPFDWKRSRFSSKLEELNIRYVLVSKGHFKISGPNYNPKEEYDRLMMCLNENRAILIYDSDTASIYEIPSDP